MQQKKVWTRREIIAMGPALGALLAAAAFPQTKLEFTPALVMGPFYPQAKPADQDIDLTEHKGKASKAKGSVIEVSGRVLNVRGEPIRDVQVEIWQADSNGRYAHASDPNPAALDANFQGYCSLRTDSQGRYRFMSVMPGAYPGMRAGTRTPHIHFQVHGRTDRLVTQMFFPKERLNETDTILQGLRNETVRKAVTATEISSIGDPDYRLRRFVWDCVLLTG